jgi:hypothetical protein
MIYIVVGGLVVLAWYKSAGKGKLTPERDEIYQEALEHLTDPEKLRILADVFEKEGLHIKALVLRKRADLWDLDPSVKRAHRAAFRLGMKSENIPGILTLADEFEKITATGAARELRAHALDVKHGRFNVKTRVATPKEEAKAAPVKEVVEEKKESLIEIVVTPEDTVETNGSSEAVKLAATVKE